MNDTFKSVTPVICSTGLDFTRELNHIYTCVAPQINEYYIQRGSSFSPIDAFNAEWRPDVECVRTTLDYVRLGRPFAIFLLGDKYGQHVSTQEILTNTNTSSSRLSYHHESNANWLGRSIRHAIDRGYRWLENDIYATASLLELQIMQAAFIDEMEYCYFYIRVPAHVDHLFIDLSPAERRKKLRLFQPESVQAQKKLLDLKQRIIKSGLPVKYFCTLEDLRGAIVDDFEKLIGFQSLERNYFRANCPEDEMQGIYVSQQRLHYSLTEMDHEVIEVMSQFCDITPPSRAWDPLEVMLSRHKRREPSEIIQKSMQKKSNEKVEKVNKSRILALIGRRGSGVGGVIAHWLGKFQTDHPDAKIIYHSAQRMDSTVNTLRRLCRLLHQTFDIVNFESTIDYTETADMHYEFLRSRFYGALSMGPVVLVLDSVEFFLNYEASNAEKAKQFDWLPNPLPSHCRVILSSIESDSTFEQLRSRDDIQVINVSNLHISQQQLAPSLESANSVFQLAKQNKYTLAFDQDFLFLYKNWKCRQNPFAQQLLLHEFHLLGPGPAWEELYSTLLETQTLNEIMKKVLSHWVAQFSWKKPIQQDHYVRTFNDEDKFKPKEWDGWYGDALSLIALSQQSLTFRDLQHLIEAYGYRDRYAVSSQDWLKFLTVTHVILVHNHTYLTFRHRHFQEICEHIFLGCVVPVPVETRSHATKTPSLTDTRFRLHSLLAQFYENRRQIPHALYHYDRASNFTAIATLLSQTSVISEWMGDPHNSSLSMWDAAIDIAKHLQTLQPLHTLPVPFQTMPSQSMQEPQSGEETFDYAAEPLKNDYKEALKIMDCNQIVATTQAPGTLLLSWEELVTHWQFNIIRFAFGQSNVPMMESWLQITHPNPEQAVLGMRMFLCELQWNPLESSSRQKWLDYLLLLLQNVLKGENPRPFPVDHFFSIAECQLFLLREHPSVFSRGVLADFVFSEEFLKYSPNLGREFYHLKAKESRAQKKEVNDSLAILKQSQSCIFKRFGLMHPLMSASLLHSARLLKDVYGINPVHTESAYRLALHIWQSTRPYDIVRQAEILLEFGTFLSYSKSNSVLLESRSLLYTCHDICMRQLGPDCALAVQSSTLLTRIERLIQSRSHAKRRVSMGGGNLVALSRRSKLRDSEDSTSRDQGISLLRRAAHTVMIGRESKASSAESSQPPVSKEAMPEFRWSSETFLYRSAQLFGSGGRNSREYRQTSQNTLLDPNLSLTLTTTPQHKRALHNVETFDNASLGLFYQRAMEPRVRPFTAVVLRSSSRLSQKSAVPRSRSMMM